MSLCEWSLVLTGGGVEGGAGQEYLHDCALPPLTASLSCFHRVALRICPLRMGLGTRAASPASPGLLA